MESSLSGVTFQTEPLLPGVPLRGVVQARSLAAESHEILTGGGKMSFDCCRIIKASGVSSSLEARRPAEGPRLQ